MPEDEVTKAIEKVGDDIKKFRCYPDAGPIGGVCAGLAYRLGTPAWLVRLVWFVLFWFAGVGGLLYLALWLFVPEAATPTDFAERTGNEPDSD